MRWKWLALHPIHMHYVWSETDDWLLNFTIFISFPEHDRTHNQVRHDAARRINHQQQQPKTIPTENVECSALAKLLLVFHSLSSELTLANSEAFKIALSMVNGKRKAAQGVRQQMEICLPFMLMAISHSMNMLLW